MIKLAIFHNLFFVHELSSGVPSTAMYFTELPVGSLPPIVNPVVASVTFPGILFLGPSPASGRGLCSLWSGLDEGSKPLSE